MAEGYNSYQDKKYGGSYKPEYGAWGMGQSEADFYAEQKKWQKEQQRKDYEKKLDLYDQTQVGQRERLLTGFRQFSEAQTGRGLGNILKTQALTNQRRGIEFSGLGSRGMAEQQAALQGQALGAQQGYASQLSTMQAQNRDAFVRGEFSFMNQMDLQLSSQRFQRELMQMQARLQQDAESRANMFGLAGSIGSWLVGGPVGGAVGGLFSNRVGAGEGYANTQWMQQQQWPTF